MPLTRIAIQVVPLFLYIQGKRAQLVVEDYLTRVAAFRVVLTDVLGCDAIRFGSIRLSTCNTILP